MRKRQRISIDLNPRKPKLQINHSISKNIHKSKDENKEVINNPYLAHTLNSSTSSDINPPPPPSPPPLPPPPPIINDTSNSLTCLLNYNDSSSESESDDNSHNNITENEKNISEEKEKEKENTDLMNSFETFLSEINELEKKNTNDSQIKTDTTNSVSSVQNNIVEEPSLIKERKKSISCDNENSSQVSSYLKDNTSFSLYHNSSAIIINKLAYLSSDKSIIYSTTPVQDYLYHHIEFSTRYKDWSVGALNSEYFINYHNEINNLLTQIEEYFSPSGWKIRWDGQNSLYYYENLKSKSISWEYPTVIEAQSELIINKNNENNNDDENMELESDNEVISYTETSVKEKSKKEEKLHTTKHKKITTIKDKNMLKLMEKWKKVEDSLNNSDNEKEEKIERWAEEQKNK